MKKDRTEEAKKYYNKYKDRITAKNNTESAKVKRKELNKVYYLKNKSKIRERNKKYYDQNKSKILRLCKEYHNQNKTVILNRRKEYYYADIEKTRLKAKEAQKKYYEKNKEKCKQKTYLWRLNNKEKLKQKDRERYRRKLLDQGMTVKSRRPPAKSTKLKQPIILPVKVQKPRISLIDTIMANRDPEYEFLIKEDE